MQFSIGGLEGGILAKKGKRLESKPMPSLCGSAVERQPRNQEIAGLIPGLGTCRLWTRSPVEDMQEAADQ